MFGHAQDIIDNPDIHLDEMFVASLVFDLIKVSVRNADLLNFDVVYSVQAYNFSVPQILLSVKAAGTTAYMESCIFWISHVPRFCF